MRRDFTRTYNPTNRFERHATRPLELHEPRPNDRHNRNEYE